VGIPRRFWMYAAFAVLYGVCETVNGWSQLEMTNELGASTTEAAIALTVFWARVTVGRVVFAAVDRWLPVGTTYHVLPFLLAGIFVVIAFLPSTTA
jgi:fucose permease